MREIVLAIAGAFVAASLYFSGAGHPVIGRLFAALAAFGFLSTVVTEGVRQFQRRRDFERRWAKLTTAEQLGMFGLLKQDGPLTDGELSHILGRDPSENVLTSAYKKTRLLMKHDYQGTYEVDPEWLKHVRRKKKRLESSRS